MFSNNVLQSYLFFGGDYTGIRRGLELLRDCDTSACRAWVSKASRAQLVAEGVRRLKQATTETLEQADSRWHALQLSGGYDSRVILGALLEHLSPQELVTLTFGTPGTPDYEIPQQLAKYTGVRHEKLDATTLRWEANSVVDYASTAFERLPAALVVERYINYRLRMMVGTEPDFWVGFLAGAVAGSVLPAQPSHNWDAVVDFFLRRNHRTRSTALTRLEWDPRSVLPQQPLVDPSLIGLDDQFNIAIRQACLIEIPWRDFRDRYIFNQPVWKSFMLALPWEERANGTPLYLNIIAEAFPKLSTFPVQGGRKPPKQPGRISRLLERAMRKGRRVAERLVPVNSGAKVADVMRLDYAKDLRSNSDHAVLIRDLTRSLSERKTVPHVDVESLWHEHLGGNANHASALLTLAGLEVNLRAIERMKQPETINAAEIRSHE